MRNERDVEHVTAPILLALRLVWALGAGAVLVYLAIGEFVALQAPIRVEDTVLRLLVPTCCGFGVLAVIAGLFVAVATKRTGMRQAQDLRAAGRVLLKSALLAAGCSETPALLGLVVRILGAGRPAQFLLTVVALAGVCLHIPNPRELAREIQAKARRDPDFSLAPLPRGWWQRGGGG